MIGLHRCKDHDGSRFGFAACRRPLQGYLCFQDDFFDFDMDSAQTCGAAGLFAPITSRPGPSTAEQDKSSCLIGDPVANYAEHTKHGKQSHLSAPQPQDNPFRQPDTAQLQHVDQAGCLCSPTASEAEQQPPNATTQAQWKPVAQRPPAVMQQGEWRSFSLPPPGPPSPVRQQKCSIPAINAAARQVLVECITSLGGVSPAARATLQQLVSNMASADDSQDRAAGSPVAAASAATSGSPAMMHRHVSAAERLDSMLVPSELQQTAASALQHPVSPAQQQQETTYTTAAPAATVVPDAAAANVASPQLQVQPSVGTVGLTAAAAAVAAAGLTDTKLLPQQLAGRATATPAAAVPTRQPALPATTAAGHGDLVSLMLSPQLSSGRSSVLHKTRVLAAELGAVRPGAAGSSLRLAGNICRSNSGTLVDSLMSEAARADAGLLTAAMPRSDSLPDALLSGSVAPAGSGSGEASAAAAVGAKPSQVSGDGKAPMLTDSVRECLKDVQTLTSLNITDLDIPMTWSGLPSLTALLEQKSLWVDTKSAEPSLAPTGPTGATAVELPAQCQQHVEQRQQLQQPQPSIGAEITAVPQQQHQSPDTVLAVDHFGMQPTPFLTPAGMTREGEDTALPPPSPAPAVAVGTAHQPGHSAAATLAAHWVSKSLGKTSSSNAQGRVAAALLAHETTAACPGAAPVPPPAAAAGDVHVGGAALMESNLLQHGAFGVSAAPAGAAAPEPLTLPHLLDPGDAFFAGRPQPPPHMMPVASQPQQYMPGTSAALKPSTSMQLRQMQVELGMFGTALASAPGHLGMQHVQHQDTLDGLLEQVNQELMAEAYVKQQSVLQFGTAGIAGGMQHVSAAAAGMSARDVMRSPFTGIPDMSLAASQAGALQWQGARGVDVYTAAPRWHNPVSDAGGEMYSGLGAAAAGGYDAGGYDPGVSRGLLMYGGVGTASPLTPTAAAAMDGRPAGKQEIVRYSRVITCKTYLKRLNITQPMAEHLLPYHNVHGPPCCTTSTAAATTDDGDDSPKAGGKSSSSYELMFKEEVCVVDVSGARYKVVYEGVSCNQQKHLRLTSGWRDYIRGHGVQVGDTVVFERRGADRHTLYVSVLKGDGELGGAADDDQEGPRTKKRRVSRSQAVQRLE